MPQQLLLLKYLLPHILAPPTFLLFFALPPFPFRKPVYLIIFLTFFYFSFLFDSHTKTGHALNPQIRLPLALVWMYYLDWLTKMCLHSQPEHDFWRVSNRSDAITKATGAEGTGSPPTTARAYLVSQPHGFSEKLRWAFSLLSSPRGVGWNYQIHHGSEMKTGPLADSRDQKTGAGTWGFVALQICRCIFFLILSQGITVVLMRWSSFDQAAAKIEFGSHTWEVNWRKLCLLPLIGIKLWANIQAHYACVNILFVATGLAKKEECVPLFGDNLTSLDSLQEFWGTFWQQSFRRMFNDLGRTACRTFRVPRRTQLAWLVYIWISFLLSGLIQGFAVGYALALPNETINVQHFKAILQFFLLQALGLTMETLFLDTPVKDITLYEVGLEDELIMGRVWTWGWLLMSGYWAFDSWFAISAVPPSLLFIPFPQSWNAVLMAKNLRTPGWIAKLGWYLSGDGGLLE
ncbi:hypothetical protein V8F20_012051 [Naviculisporaceae sp. PSN 640]